MHQRNMKRVPIISGLLFIFALFGTSLSQPTLNLQLAPSLEMAEVVYVSDFVLLGESSIEITKYLFQLTVDNQGQPEADGFLTLELLHDGGSVAIATTQPFLLPADAYLSASNIQLAEGYTIPGTGEIIKLDPQRVSYPTQEFEDEIFSSGVLQKGTYNIVVTFRYNTTEEVSAPPVSFTVNNPTYIRPITPGGTTISGYQEIIYTQFPTFQFETDFDGYQSPNPPYNVQVFKVLDQIQAAGMDETTTTTPHLDEWTYETAFSYPVAGVQPLEPGTYIWRVQLRYISSSGTMTKTSPLAEFRVEDPSKLGEIENMGLKSDILQILLDVLGEKRGTEIALGLSDYNLIAIRLNGQTIDKKKFYEVLKNYEGEIRQISDIILMGSQQ